MPRPLRIEYPGAIYHIMNRGDRREDIFKDDSDPKWENELRLRPKGDPANVAMDRRLRKQSTTSLKWIADRLQMGSWSYVSNLLREWK